MASITATVGSFKLNPTLALPHDLIDRACVQAGHTWRDRVFGPAVTIQLFMLQVLYGNCSCRRLMRIAGYEQDQSRAYNLARHRLPLLAVARLARGVIQTGRQACDQAGRWKGHRVLIVDGSGLSMPDKPHLLESFGMPSAMKAGCGFPVMHVLWVMEMTTGLIRDLAIGPWNTHDMHDACDLHGHLEAGDVLVGDRAFDTYAHLASLEGRGLHGLFRVHQKLTICFKPHRKAKWQVAKAKRKGLPNSAYIKKLGKGDQLVRYRKPSKAPEGWNQAAYDALPDELTVRELRVAIRGRDGKLSELTLQTTLLDPQAYPKQELEALYRRRWQIETDLRSLKGALGMDVLRCETVPGVLRELWVYVMVYNRVREQMAASAQRQSVDPDRLSFIDMLDAMRYQPQDVASTRILVNPLRPDRDEPRVIKRRKDRYTYMTRPRDTLRKELGIQRNAA